MKVVKRLPIPDCYEIKFPNHIDERGSFQRFFCSKTMAEEKLNSEWVQSNISLTATKGTIRGLHLLDEKLGEHKLVSCVKGKAFDVIVDLRKDSETFGKWFAIELNEADSTSIYISPGCAHGFQTLQNNTVIIYAHSASYEPAAERGLNFADPSIGVKWPLKLTKISKRDQLLPNLCEF